MKHLFIGGCARSGTTGLVRLLNNDNRVLIGVERFIKVRDSITPAHFEKEHFLNPTEDETHFLEPELYERLRDKWDRGMVQYVGDKVPRYYDEMNYLFDTIPDARFLFLWRDLPGVASSYNVRAQRQDNWPKDRDYRRAVVHWNDSLKNLHDIVQKGYQDFIHVVKYESFFSGEPVCLETLYGFLDIRLRPKDEAVFKKITTNNWSRISSKPLALDDGMFAYLDEHKDKELEIWATDYVARQYAVSSD